MKIENNLKQEKEKLTKIANSFNQEEYDYYLQQTNQSKYEIICQELILNQTIQQIPLRFRIHISQLPNQLKQTLIKKLQVYQDPAEQESVKFRQYVESLLKLPLNIYQNMDNSYTNNNNSNYINEIPDELRQYLQNVFINKKQKNQDINPTKRQNNEKNKVSSSPCAPVHLEDIIQQIVKKQNKRPYPFKKDIERIKKRKLNLTDELAKCRQEQRQTIINYRSFQNFIKQLNQSYLQEEDSSNSTEDTQEYSKNSTNKSDTKSELLQNKKNNNQALFRVRLKKEENHNLVSGNKPKTFIVNQQNLEEYIYNQIDQEQIDTKVQDDKLQINNKGILKLNQQQMEKAEEIMQKYNVQEDKDKKKRNNKQKNLQRNIYEDNKKMLNSISEQLNKEIYQQQEAKQQLLQIMAKWIRGPQSTGITIGLQSPPGCGKTALVKNGLAKALDRPVQFINLGGMKDLSVLKGHSYCYVGSTYGLIAQSLIDSKCMNPIIVFDELDKLDETQNQIPQFLMHITDPTQNQQFIDDYFQDITIDLSKCLFIFTYNNSERINKILYDRINEVRMRGYNDKQKIEILQNFSIPKLLKNYQFEKDQINFDQETLNYLVQNYSQNEGVRKLEQNIEQMIANINLQYYTNENNKQNTNFEQVMVTKNMVQRMLKNQKNDFSLKMMYI